MIETIIVAVLSLAGTLCGTMYGIYKANNLVTYRLEQLEKKMDIHNGVQDRVLTMEQELKFIKAIIDKIERVQV